MRSSRMGKPCRWPERPFSHSMWTPTRNFSMMKLIIAIVHHTDGDEVLRALIEAHFSVTRIASSGGFLRRGNATLWIGLQAEQVPAAVQLIREHTAPPVDPGLKRATVFVLNVERAETV